MAIIAVAVIGCTAEDIAIQKMQVEEQLKEVWSVMKGMMEFIIARTNTEIGYINARSVDTETILEWIMTDKKE